jgi:hypothetical protein
MAFVAQDPVTREIVVDDKCIQQVKNRIISAVKFTVKVKSVFNKKQIHLLSRTNEYTNDDSRIYGPQLMQSSFVSTKK